MRATVLLVIAFALILGLGACSETQGSDEPLNDMEHIWSLTDTNDFVIAMTEHLNEKTNYGANMLVLSEAERIFYITQTLEMEVNNGGFSQFFYNSGGDFSDELVGAFRAIGADTTGAICQKAIDAVGCDLPVDRNERIELLNELGENLDEIFEECDDAFLSYEDDLCELNYNFAVKNKEQFN